MADDRLVPAGSLPTFRDIARRAADFDHVDDRPACEVCRGVSTIDEIALGLAPMLTCPDHQAAIFTATAERQLRAVIPDEFQAAREIPDALRAWTGTDDVGVFLHGPVGRGKTYTAAALLKRGWVAFYRTHGRAPTVRWLDAVEFMEAMRAGYANGKSASHLDRAKGVDLLVVDDLGAERATEWTRERWYELVNHRRTRRRSTIWTSNWDLDHIADRFTPKGDESLTEGERIVSRIYGSSIVVHMKSGGDRRRTETGRRVPRAGTRPNPEPARSGET